jgi:hypothetical protein
MPPRGRPPAALAIDRARAGRSKLERNAGSVTGWPVDGRSGYEIGRAGLLRG